MRFFAFFVFDPFAFFGLGLGPCRGFASMLPRGYSPRLATDGPVTGSRFRALCLAAQALFFVTFGGTRRLLRFL